jgi:hypothetical protein
MQRHRASPFPLLFLYLLTSIVIVDIDNLSVIILSIRVLRPMLIYDIVHLSKLDISHIIIFLSFRILV